jgi:ABC-type antimicrobial peptide transport system permease subunit
LQQVDPVPVAFILFSWMPYARLMNTGVLRLKNTEYVEAARVAGVKNFKIIFRHLVPNSIAPVIVMGAKDVGGMVLCNQPLLSLDWAETLPGENCWHSAVIGSSAREDIHLLVGLFTCNGSIVVVRDWLEFAWRRLERCT